jgi:hypothetical protein
MCPLSPLVAGPTCRPDLIPMFWPCVTAPWGHCVMLSPLLSASFPWSDLFPAEPITCGARSHRSSLTFRVTNFAQQNTDGRMNPSRLGLIRTLGHGNIKSRFFPPSWPSYQELAASYSLIRERERAEWEKGSVIAIIRTGWGSKSTCKP